jgi:hypothetical protein
VGGLETFDCPYLFAPFGTSLVLHTHTALQSTLGATVLGRLPTVRAHNVVLLAGLAANGVAAYALAFYHLRRVAQPRSRGRVRELELHLRSPAGPLQPGSCLVIPVSTLAWIAFLARPAVGRAVAVAVSERRPPIPLLLLYYAP